MSFSIYLVAVIFFSVSVTQSDAQCTIPTQFQGDWFSLLRGQDLDTQIDVTHIRSKGDRDDFSYEFHGQCFDRWDDNTTVDADGNHDSWILFFDSKSRCYQCYQIYFRSRNILQYKQSSCNTPGDGIPPSMEAVCSEITQHTDMSTWFRKTLITVNCKNTFEGVFHFTYEWDTGGGGICNSPYSLIVGCQEPGSPYVDNQVFTMNFGKCDNVQSSKNREIRFQCMGAWQDDAGNVWAGVADLGADVYRERFRCMLTRDDQEVSDMKFKYTMSWWADCSKLKSPYEGPVRLEIMPVVGGFQLDYSEPGCNFPTNYSGHWYHTGEFDMYADINNTHIYFKTILDQYTYKEAYFTCLMAAGNRFLTVALTVGKCEIDYVCWEMLPRHHSIIRWRQGKPFRLTEIEMAYPNYEMYMFRQACTFSSFTINRDEFHWNWKTFMLDPPVPIECPVRGRYKFIQYGLESELIRTRIRGGYTENPRHTIDCRNFVTEYKSCDDIPSKISLDAEYCETLDHTGKPIGEYDEADWELTCIGNWDEDWNSYMITWDPEDVMSAFRCWNYERLDWRFVRMSRSTSGACGTSLTSSSWHPDDGASLYLYLEENERLYDDCAGQYLDGDPWMKRSDIQDWSSSTTLFLHHMAVLLSLITTVVTWCTTMS